MTEVRAYGSAETTARHSPPSSLQPSIVAGKEFLRFPFGENEARASLFSMSMGRHKTALIAKI